MKLQKIEIIPYKTFKDRIRITKELERKGGKIRFNDDYIMYEGSNDCINGTIRVI